MAKIGMTQPRGQSIMAALGQFKADLVLKNAQVLNVFTGEFMTRDVAICRDRIIGIGSYSGLREYNLSGKYIVPGFIDTHTHIESSMTTPQRFCREVLLHGTTTVIADPHEIANVCGHDGLSFMLDEAEKAVVNLYYMLPSCVPTTELDSAGVTLDAQSLSKYMHHKAVLGLGEMMNVPGVIRCQSDVYQKLSMFRSMVIDGHAPMLHGNALQTYCLAGMMTDHESTSGEEAAEKIRAGLAVLIREGSGAKNLDAIAEILIDGRMNTSRVAFCTDDKHVDDIRREGHIDYHIKRCIELGMEPAKAYTIASHYAAQIYGLTHLGAVAAGYQADLVVLNDLENVSIEMVFHKGKTARVWLEEPICEDIPKPLLNTVHLPHIKKNILRLPVTKAEVPVILPVAHEIKTERADEAVRTQNGVFVPDSVHQKVAVVERHRATGKVGLGIIRGFMKKGAIASTVGHDSHNITVIGTNDDDMMMAIHALHLCGGGYVIVCDGKILAGISLPVGGLMSDKPTQDLQKEQETFLKAAREIGIPEEYDPYQTLSFLPLSVLPKLRVTTSGLFDAVKNMELTY